jgi:glycosyltransferase involved in cell wall biosynthesis
VRILIVNDSDSLGGAARAAYRLYQSLSQEESVECYMFVRQKIKNDEKIYSMRNVFFNKIRSKINNIPKYIYRNRTKTLFSCSFLPNNEIKGIIELINPDIIHLHWVNNGFLHIKDLIDISKPIVWSLHDEWPFTGGCHYDESCDEYTKQCGSCTVLKSKNKYDFSYFNHKEKAKSYRKISKLCINGLSHWIYKRAKQSSVFSTETKFSNLPNPIDTDIFFPNKDIILDKTEIVILVGAASKNDDPRKGFDLLVAALNLLDKEKVLLNIIGNDFDASELSENISVVRLGNIADDAQLSSIYSQSDLTVVPSKQENLSNMIMESLSCGTPVVAFNIGGNGDMIEHKHNGYLAEPLEPRDLANGILWVFENNKIGTISEAAREKIISDYSYPVVSKKYLSLYADLLK